MSCPDRTAFKCAMHMVKWMDDQKERGLQFSAEEYHPLYHFDPPDPSNTNNIADTYPTNILPSTPEKDNSPDRKMIPSIRVAASITEKNTPPITEVIPPIKGVASITEKNTPSITGDISPRHQGAYSASVEDLQRRLAPDDNTRVYSAPHRLLPVDEWETFNPIEPSDGVPGTAKRNTR